MLLPRERDGFEGNSGVQDISAILHYKCKFASLLAISTAAAAPLELFAGPAGTWLVAAGRSARCAGAAMRMLKISRIDESLLNPFGSYSPKLAS